MSKSIRKSANYAADSSMAVKYGKVDESLSSLHFCNMKKSASTFGGVKKKIKCGEIMLFNRNLSFVCGFCGTELMNLSLFLRHIVQQHLRAPKADVETLLTQLDEVIHLKKNQGPLEEFETVFADQPAEFYEASDTFKVDELTDTECSLADCSENLDVLNSQKCDSDDKINTESAEIDSVEVASERSTHSRDFEIDLVKDQKNNNSLPASRQKRKYVISSDPTLTFKCEQCTKTFVKSYKLTAHRRRFHDKVKVFACDYCDASFTESSNLRVHHFRHLGIKPHKCTLCDKAFTSSTELKLHVRSHTGERPYKCSVCEQSFTSSAHLSSHRRRHFNERPYQCQTCGKCFYESKLLRDHQVSHSDKRPFVCDTCQMAFSRKKALMEHSKLHLDFKQYSCKICKKEFAQGAGLYSHMKKKHPL